MNTLMIAARNNSKIIGLMSKILLHSLLCFFGFFGFFVFGVSLSKTSISDDQLSNLSSYRKAPRALLEFWLRFHEIGLCQGLDAVFDFNESGMKVQSLIEDEKSYQKFQELIQPLQRSFQIELDVSRPAVEKKEKEKEKEGEEEAEHKEKDPPPSIWENYELRYNLGDSSVPYGDQEDSIIVRHSLFPEDVIKQRLYLYAVQTIELNRKMGRYASDLANLDYFRQDPEIKPDLRARAKKICFAHARELGRIILKLNANLSLAIPKSKQKGKALETSGKSIADSKSIPHSAINIVDAAHVVAQGVDRFIHPEQFTVGLSELRAPGLLHSLKNLSMMCSDYQKGIGKSKSK
jgi:hypothetical protein